MRHSIRAQRGRARTRAKRAYSSSVIDKKLEDPLRKPLKAGNLRVPTLLSSQYHLLFYFLLTYVAAGHWSV